MARLLIDHDKAAVNPSSCRYCGGEHSSFACPTRDINAAERWLDARFRAHVARRDEAPPLVVAMAEASEAEALAGLTAGTYPIAGSSLFAIEVREGPVKRFGDGGRP